MASVMQALLLDGGRPCSYSLSSYSGWVGDGPVKGQSQYQSPCSVEGVPKPQGTTMGRREGGSKEASRSRGCPGRISEYD